MSDSNKNSNLEILWGPTGHYTIGTHAVYAVDRNKYPKLAELIDNNAGNISYSDEAIINNQFNTSVENFTPLVDVPDVVFKAKVTGISRFPYENPNHYSDVDLENTNGKTLLELSNEGNLTVEFWQSFYDELGHTEIKQRGLLPFRVKQIFREMVSYLQNGDELGFICAAGVLGHYIGDSCQTLHGSQFTNGDGVREETKGIHSAYETTMIYNNREGILSVLNSYIDAQKTSGNEYDQIPAIENEDDAAKACLRLLEVSMDRIPPMDLNNVYYDAVTSGTKASAVVALWENFGEETTDSIARGARYLAKIWEAAWEVAQAENNAAIKTAKISETKLKNLYEDKENFLKSYSLDQIGAYFNA